jgi:hypothetical protein
MNERNGSLCPDQLRAIGSPSGPNPSDLDGLDAETVADWGRPDARFIAGLNRAKTYRGERLRNDV